MRKRQWCEEFPNYKKLIMLLKRILSLLLGSQKPKPAYALVPKQNNSKIPQKKSN
jgi:hypothetical protein